MNGSILFVCAANVCRSPLMQYVFLGAIADLENWTVVSAGVSTRAKSPICRLVRHTLLRSEQEQDLADEHASTPLDDALIESADLVITASRAERAALARYVPDARQRLFTLTEAVLLGRCTSVQRSPSLLSPSAAVHADLLDASRGMLVMPRQKRQRRYLGTHSRAHPLDIPDAHHRRRGAHMNMLKRVRTEALELASQLMSTRNVAESEKES